MIAKRTSLTLALILATLNLFADRHYGVADGLPTGEVHQIIELPDGRMLVNCEGVFCLADGHGFTTLGCDRRKTYRLPDYQEGYGHWWQGDSLLWLRDFYRLYLYDVRQETFRYDVDKTQAMRTLRHILPEASSDRYQAMLDSIGFEGQAAVVTFDRQGRIWVGTWRDGIHLLSARHAKARTEPWSEAWARQLQGAKDNRGRIWMATAEGLDCHDGDTCSHYGQENTDSLIHNRIRFALPLADGRILLCNHMHYLGYLIPGSGHFHPLNLSLPRIEQYRVLVGACPLDDDARRVLIYSQNGAFLLDTQADTLADWPPCREIERTSDKYNCVLRDSRGRVWIGTQNGLFVIKGKGQVVEVPNLASPCIRSLVEDDSGCIWVGSSYGISRVTPQLAVTSYGKSDGVPLVSMGERQACRLPDGTLAFGHPEGVTLFRPERLAASPRSIWWQSPWLIVAVALLLLVALLSSILFVRHRSGKKPPVNLDELISSPACPTDSDTEDGRFALQLLKAVEANIDNADYSAALLARDVAMSRSALYRKMQALLGITPNDFIRNVRLKRAAHLLTTTQLPVNQVAERVGFNTPRYFSQYFKQMFGVNPSEYKGR